MPNASIVALALRFLATALALLSMGCEPSFAQGWPGMETSPFAAPQQVAPRAAPRPLRTRHAPQAAPKPEPPKAEAQPAPSANEPPPPYEPELLRLSEILGALTYLRDICGAADADSWRGRMQALLDSEAKTATRKEHLAGAYNRGFHGYEISYRACTPNAEVIIKRFLAEGEKIAHEVANRYGAS
jgi:uncharacterized protein (TIGR02301 family)